MEVRLDAHIARTLGTGKVVATLAADSGGRYLSTGLFHSP